ncbi:MAG: hypothetical protein KHX03_01295 [Clostridium sp.]|nr:hypothetical protein [Clostridium sp.]
MNMNRDNEHIFNNDEYTYDENQLKHIKMQNDLIRLIRVLDDCIENVDNFYCYTMKKQFLATSTNN